LYALIAMATNVPKMFFPPNSSGKKNGKHYTHIPSTSYDIIV